MSDTPRTDDLELMADEFESDAFVVHAYEVRKLERELAAALAEVLHWKHLYECAQNANSYRQDAIDEIDKARGRA